MNSNICIAHGVLIGLEEPNDMHLRGKGEREHKVGGIQGETILYISRV